MIDKIKKRIDDYIEFDSDELFKNVDLVRIFGGAIRDSIADLEIHDVDILVSSKSFFNLRKTLKKFGYHYMSKLVTKDIADMYKKIHIINEPHTFIKNNKIIQLIRPSIKSDKNSDDYYKESFERLISQVDISCCGVSYDGKNLYEDRKYAILHCLNKKYVVNQKSSMYDEMRNLVRRCKLEERGWSIIKFEDEYVENRNLKIANILV